MDDIEKQPGVTTPTTEKAERVPNNKEKITTYNQSRWQTGKTTQNLRSNIQKGEKTFQQIQSVFEQNNPTPPTQAERQQAHEQSKSKKPKVAHKVWVMEAFFIITFVILIDIIQIILDIFLVGAVVNRIIDIVLVIIVFLWLLLTSRMNSRVILLTVATFVGEAIPVVDLLPLWSLEITYLIHIINSGKVQTYSIRQLATRKGRESLAMDTASSIKTVAPKGTPVSTGKIHTLAEKAQQTTKQIESPENPVKKIANKSIDATQTPEKEPRISRPTYSSNKKDQQDVTPEKDSASFNWGETYERFRQQYPYSTDQTIRNLVTKAEIDHRRKTNNQ